MISLVMQCGHITTQWQQTHIQCTTYIRNPTSATFFSILFIQSMPLAEIHSLYRSLIFFVCHDWDSCHLISLSVCLSDQVQKRGSGDTY